MKITLQGEESLTIQAGTSLNDAFININSIFNQDNFNNAITVSAFEMHQIFIMHKDRTNKMFIFRKNTDVMLSDLGYYKDAKIIYSNSNLKNDR